jgi:hypothetical protein
MSLVLPTPGADSGVWDDYLNAALGGLVDAHTHIPGEGRQVPTAGININEDLSIGSNRLTFVNGTAYNNLPAVLTTGARETFVSGGNLYYRNNSGQNVRITLGSTIDFTGFGGIGGDYATVGALLQYVDSGDKYQFLQEDVLGVRHFAKNESADVILHPFHAAGAPGDVVPATTIKANASLAASYSLTLPTGLPAGSTVVKVDNTGALSFPDNAGNLTVDDLTVEGAATFEANATFESTATFEQDATFQADIKHGDRVLAVTSYAFQLGTAADWNVLGLGIINTTAATFAYWTSPLLTGDRVKTITFRMEGNIGTTGDVNATAFLVSATGTTNIIGSTTFSNLPVADDDYVLDLTDSTLAAGETVFFSLEFTESGMGLYNARLTFDRP